MYDYSLIIESTEWEVYYPFHYIQVLRTDLIFLLSTKFVYALCLLVQDDC